MNHFDPIKSSKVQSSYFVALVDVCYSIRLAVAIQALQIINSTNNF